MIFHFVVNSLVVFLILALFVEFFLFAFNLKNARIRCLCRLFPILKIPFDLLIILFYGESLFVNFNPFSCEKYLQELVMHFLPPTQTEFSAEHFLITPRYLASSIPPPWLNFLLSGIILTSCVAFGRKVFSFIHSFLYFRTILASSLPCHRPISNSLLLAKLRQNNVRILISDQIHIPFAAHLHDIFLPKDLVEDFSQNEFEAVIAHELEHLYWKDPVFKMLNDLICSLFWWIPSAWWLKRMETEQEYACDSEVYRYGIETYALANAMVKVVKRAKYFPCQFLAICPFNSAKNSHIQRLKNILHFDHTSQKTFYCCQSLLGISLSFLSFICFWIC